LESSSNKSGPSPVDPTDERLVQRACEGDRHARGLLFERHREAAYAVALRVTGRNEDALDVVQDAFLRAFERLADFQREAGFRTWLLRIVTNRSLDLLRSRKVRVAMSISGSRDDDADPGPQPAAEIEPAGHQLDRQVLAQRLAGAMEALPPDQRAAFALFATGELSYAEIAQTLGIPIGTVMSRLYHARRKLFELLPDLAPDGA
jgi:RNA polymerase sigma-70 factor, ECF subfamily